MPELPDVAVVIPAYNGERFLHETLEGAAWQTCPPAEIMVVDDGSTDRTADIANAFPGVQVISQENLGVSVARNAGVAATNSEIIAFLDADDIWLPDKLERQHTLLQENPDADLALCGMRQFIVDGYEPPPWFRAHGLGIEMPCQVPSSWFVYRTAFERAGPFNPALRGAEDIEWLGRAYTREIRSVTTPEVLLLRRIHDSNSTLIPEPGHESLLRALRHVIRGRRKGTPEA